MGQRTWLITGASRGFGAEIAKAVLAAGDRLIATARMEPVPFCQSRNAFSALSRLLLLSMLFSFLTDVVSATAGCVDIVDAGAAGVSGAFNWVAKATGANKSKYEAT